MESSRWSPRGGILADARYVLTGSNDGTARLWFTDHRELIAYACTRVFRDFSYGTGDFRETGNEWRLYGISDSEPTCPEPDNP